MVERICPNCGKAYQLGDEVCRFCGYVFPFSTVELSRGTVLHGRYEVQELIHTGGMGFVYLARDKTLFDRPCIVKQIREPIRSEEHRRKLEEEALRMARLNNPNIAMILDHFIENGRYFLIVERIRGKTLLEVFREHQSQLKEEEVVKWAIGICDVIAYIHKEGVIHRDISPDNIMLTDEGAIKFIDFGTLREFRYVVTGGTAGMGKYGYTPPEQWQGRPELRSDIFALGATIYYLLTGFLPLSKELTTGQPPQREDFYPRFPPIRMNNPKVSPQLEVILQKALQLDVANRFASVVEMRQALKNLEPVTQPVARVPGKKINFKSRKSLAIISVTVACLIGVVLFITLRDGGNNIIQFPAHTPKISSSSQTTDTPLARETVASQYATTPPGIDGVLVPGEWPDTGFSKSFKYTVDDVSKDGGVTTVYFMNDSSELYVAINISAPDFKEQMFEKNDFWFQAYITYDGNNDGVIKPGERFRGFEKTSWDSGKMTITEATYKTVYLSDDGYLTTSYNTATYGMGVAGYSSTTHSYIYECSVPLNSGEEKDLVASPGDSLSLKIIIYQYFRYGDSWSRYGSIGWPGSGGVIDIDAYGILVLATEPGTSRQTSVVPTPPPTSTPTPAPTPTPTTTSTLESGLVAYYPFKGNANDDSENGNNGTVYGATLTTDRFGNVKGAYHFDGIDDYIGTDYDGILGKNPRTVSLWARTGVSDRIMWALVYGGYPGGLGNSFRCGFNFYTGAEGVNIDVSNGDILYNANISDNQWHHYVWVVPDNGDPRLTDVKIYRDGQLLTSVANDYHNWSQQTVIDTVALHKMHIGYFYDSESGIHYYFSGDIDDIRVYDRVLSETEIQALDEMTIP